MSKRYNPYDWNNRPLKNARTVTTTRFIGPIRGGRNPTYKQRMRPRQYAGYARTGGAYGRYGAAARNLGNLPEKKYFDTLTQFSIDATGEVPVTGQLSLIPEGNSGITRDGRKCTLVSWQYKAVMTFQPGANAQPSGSTSIFLILDKQCNGAAAACTDVFLSTDLVSSPMQLNNSERFVILKRWVHDWSPQAGVSGAYAPITKHISKFKTCSIPMDFSGTTGVITEIKSNNVFLMAGSESIGTIDDLVTVSGIFRFRFRG